MINAFKDFIQSSKESKVDAPLFDRPDTGLCGEINLTDPFVPFSYKYLRLSGNSGFTSAQNQEKKLRNTYQLKISNNIQHFSQFTSYDTILLRIVTYVQVWLDPGRSSRCIRSKIKPPTPLSMWKMKITNPISKENVFTALFITVSIIRTKIIKRHILSHDKASYIVHLLKRGTKALNSRV